MIFPLPCPVCYLRKAPSRGKRSPGTTSLGESLCMQHHGWHCEGCAAFSLQDILSHPPIIQHGILGLLEAGSAVHSSSDASLSTGQVSASALTPMLRLLCGSELPEISSAAEAVLIHRLEEAVSFEDSPAEVHLWLEMLPTRLGSPDQSRCPITPYDAIGHMLLLCAYLQYFCALKENKSVLNYLLNSLGASVHHSESLECLRRKLRRSQNNLCQGEHVCVMHACQVRGCGDRVPRRSCGAALAQAPGVL